MPRKVDNYYRMLDKRTTEYKDWRKRQDRRDKEQGLGDFAEKVFKYTGVKAVVEFFAGEDCGCDARKEHLNSIGGAMGKWFKDTNAKCLTQKEYTWLDEYFVRKRKNRVDGEDQYALIEIYNRVFSQRISFSDCSPCVKDLADKMESYYNNYTDETEETNTITGDK